tara:strand:- start:216 stop:353 length:138 start_codon:yes stop_codon:yes gene_type:complete
MQNVVWKASDKAQTRRLSEFSGLDEECRRIRNVARGRDSRFASPC